MPNTIQELHQQDGLLHDGHDTHHAGGPQQTRPLSDPIGRAVRLAHDPIVYPARVRVWTVGQVAGENQD